MSKTEVLTEDALSAFVIPSELLRYVERCRLRMGLSKEEMRILDFGCGRGESALRLREQGYDALGVDINPVYIENGRHLLRKRGLDADAILGLVDPSGRTALPDHYFHFVYSEQVLEHVKHLETVAAELGRITVPGGGGFHCFPAHRHLVEEHLHMPCVHYLPKNRLREISILGYLLLGLGPKWTHLEGESIKGQAHAYFEYSVNHTYYRSSKAVAKIFEKHDFRVTLVTIENPAWRRIRLADLVARFRLGLALINWALLNFKNVELVTEKRAL